MTSKTLVSIVKGSKDPDQSEIEYMVRKAIKLLGGASKFVRSGESVLIKPNLVGYYRLRGATTDPRVVRALIRIVKEVNAGNVMVGDASGIGIDTKKVLDSTGMREAAEEEGAIVLDLRDDCTIQLEVPSGRVLKRVKLYRAAVDSDVIINVPVFKNHIATQISICMKNMKGVFCDATRRAMHFTDLAEGIVDYNLAVKPTLNVVDATVALEGLGPVLPGKPRALGMIISGSDPVAVDLVCVKIMGLDIRDVEHLRKAAERNIGISDLGQIEVKGECLNEVKLKNWEHAPLSDKEIKLVAGIELVSGKSCSGCYGVICTVVEIYGDDLGKLNRLVLLTGPRARVPTMFKGRVIYFGSCLQRHKHDKGYVPGCPPDCQDLVSKMEELFDLSLGNFRDKREQYMRTVLRSRGVS